MKIKKIICLGLLAMISQSVWAANATAGKLDVNGLCDLVARLQEVFNILRTLAFIGAGFMLAKYAWEAISKGKIGGKDDFVEGTKAVGIPMLVGFVLLCSIGVLLSVLGSVSGMQMLGCITTGW